MRLPVSPGRGNMNGKIGIRELDSGSIKVTEKMMSLESPDKTNEDIADF